VPPNILHSGQRVRKQKKRLGNTDLEVEKNCDVTKEPTLWSISPTCLCGVFTPADPKRIQIQSSCQYLFALLGSACVKALRNMLMRLTLDLFQTCLVMGFSQINGPRFLLLQGLPEHPTLSNPKIARQAKLCRGRDLRG